MDPAAGILIGIVVRREPPAVDPVVVVVLFDGRAGEAGATAFPETLEVVDADVGGRMVLVSGA